MKRELKRKSETFDILSKMKTAIENLNKVSDQRDFMINDILRSKQNLTTQGLDKLELKLINTSYAKLKAMYQKSIK